MYHICLYCSLILCSLTDANLSFSMGSVFNHLKLVIADQIKHLKAIPDMFNDVNHFSYIKV